MSTTKEKKDGADETAAAKPGRFGKKQKIIIGAVAAMLLAGGGSAFALMGGKSAAGEHAGAEEAHEAPAAEGEGESGEAADPAATLVDVPAMVVNMRTATGEQRYLKLHFMLVAKDATSVEKIKSRLPAIVDAYQPFLRELRPEDLAGAAAVFRIKEELLLRAADEAGKETVADVLIQDLVQQ